MPQISLLSWFDAKPAKEFGNLLADTESHPTASADPLAPNHLKFGFNFQIAFHEYI